ncbi:sirohydrochlorin ferrochelatase [Krasilnikovia cinnamomea]|uniref:Sirohydrochlorin ferrochelatase n=1 Tax=Krasilnikovia cinnamomea TaxID=349313 RepID=A0A4Q7ZE22_9ACTN|nr:CbiX/SirB N-terminal domain-containing protein [Krasilnikovia cinnamomea]RZU48353.1 sirohydrochlorin ferrochelatase [Krasilnikovia cinnamomea]
MSRPVLVGVAHGTRSPAGQDQIRRLAADVALRRPGLDVRLAYVDVQEPRVADVVAGLGGAPAVVVPLLLSTGYHVRVDIGAAVEGGAAVITAPLGPDPTLVELLARRLEAAGPADAVVLAAAGSADARWRADVAAVARALPGLPRIGYASGSGPRVSDVVAGLRAAGARRIAVATYLLVDGLFYRTLRHAGADVVTAPLVTSGRIADLVLRRYDAAVASSDAAHCPAPAATCGR